MRSVTDDTHQKIWHSFNWGLNPTEADSKITHTRHRYPGCSAYVMYMALNMYFHNGLSCEKVQKVKKYKKWNKTDDAH